MTAAADLDAAPAARARPTASTALMRAGGLVARTGSTRGGPSCVRRVPDRRRAVATRSAGTLSIGAPVRSVRDGRGMPHVFAPRRPRPVRRLRLRDGPGPALPARPAAPQGHAARLAGAHRARRRRARPHRPDDRPARLSQRPSWSGSIARRERSWMPSPRASRPAAPDCADALPIEYALLDAGWEPWSALDSAACAMAWRWQFTGRPHVRGRPGAAAAAPRRRAPRRGGPGAQREADTPHPAAGRARIRRGLPPTPVGRPRRSGARGDRRGRSARGGRARRPWRARTIRRDDRQQRLGRRRLPQPLGQAAARDPTRTCPTSAASAFYEVGLHGGSFDAVGAGLVGLPGLAFGRNRDLAWGFTNNICSLRDLYQERPAWTASTDVFEHDGRAEPATVELVTVAVRDGSDAAFPVIRTRNGPLVDDILPPEARGTGPVSMRWLGTEPCDWPAAQLRLDRADDGRRRDGRDATAGWCPPSSLVLGDIGGGIGYRGDRCASPSAASEERGYRPGWDPAHQAGPASSRPQAMPRASRPGTGLARQRQQPPRPRRLPVSAVGDLGRGVPRTPHRATHRGRPHRLDRTDLGRDAHGRALAPRAEDTLADLRRALRAARRRAGRGAVDRRCCAAWDLRAHARLGGRGHPRRSSSRAGARPSWPERVVDRDSADYLANWGLGLAADAGARR